MTGPSRRSIVLLTLLTTLAIGSMAVAQDAQRRRDFSIRVTEPMDQGLVFGKTRLAAEVKIKDLDLIDRVEFSVGDEIVFVDREPPFECFHDFGEASRSWIVRAVAYHKEEVSVSDAVITRKLSFAAIERVNRVILWVSATDKKGNFLLDLEQDGFTVKEDGTEQEILDFFHEDRPINMAILIDTSGSMKDRLEEVHKAASSFVETLREQDRAMIIDFDDKVFLIQDLTADHEALKEAVTSTEAIGGTAIYDALHAAYRKLATIEGRKVIVLLSDGADSASQFSFDRVAEEAKARNVMIYPIGLGGGQGGAPRKGVLKEFADVTGGKFYFVTKAEDLAGVYERIAEELRKQFFIAYSTNNEEWDGRWIEIQVEHDGPIKIRARRGYFAVRGSMGG